MEENMRDFSFQADLIGREDEMEKLEELWEDVLEGEGHTIFISGEAGIGKTRLVDEFLGSVEGDASVVRGWCLSDNLQPLMPIREALRDADLYHLVSEAPPPKVISAYLIAGSGLMVTKAERQESDLDPDIFASMLNAVENFVSDSLSMMDEEGGSSLDTIGYGEHEILIQMVEGLSLATVIEGTSSEFLIQDMRKRLMEIRGKVESWDGDLESAEKIKPEIEWFIDSKKYEGQYLVEEPKLKQENLFDNVLLGTQRVADEDPVVLFLDDIQWADPTSLNLLHYLSRNTRDKSVLILGTYRPEDVMKRDEEEHPLKSTLQNMGREGLYDEIQLQRLEERDVEGVIDDVLECGGADLPTGFIERIYRESEGNPLFLLEMIRDLVEGGQMSRSDEGWEIGAVDEIDICSKIRDLVDRRLERLNVEEHELLECASVVGREFESDIVQGLTGLSRIQVLKDLNEIERKHDLIHSVKDRYRFDHSKIRDVLYSELNDELRREYHRMTAESYEELYEDEVERIAHHFYRADDKRAGGYLKEAADEASDSYANEDAIRDYKRALDFAEDTEMRIDIHVSLGDVYNRISEFSKGMEHYETAEDMEEDDLKRANIVWKIARTVNKKGDYEVAREQCNRGLELLEGEENLDKARLLNTKSWLYRNIGRFEEGDRALEMAMEIARKIDDRRELGDIEHSFGTLCFSKKEYQEALSHFEEALEIRGEVGDERGLCQTMNNIANVYDDLGEGEKALENYKEALELSENIGDKHTTATIRNNIGIIYWGRGELDRVLDHFQGSLEIFRKVGNQRLISILENNMGNVYRDKGELKGAVEHYEKSMETAEKLDNPLALVNPLNGMGKTLMERGALDEGRGHLERSLRYAEENEEKRMVLENKISLAELDIMEGDLAGAERAVDEVIDSARELGVKKMEGLARKVKGIVLGRLERWDEASVEFEESIDELEGAGDNREAVKVLYEYALMYREKGEEDAAVERLERVRSRAEDMGMELWAERAEEALEGL